MQPVSAYPCYTRTYLGYVDRKALAPSVLLSNCSFLLPGAGCSVIAFALACRLAAVVLTVTRLPEKVVLSPGTLNVPYDVMTSDLAKVAHGDADSLDEVEKEPHFSSHVQVESTETFEHEQETTVD